MDNIIAKIENLPEVLKGIETAGKKLQKPLQQTAIDFKNRATGWTAGVIVQHYGCSKKDISTAVKSKRAMGSFRVCGERVDNMTITFEGRPLTPIHFKMTPKKEPPRKKKKQVVKIGGKFVTLSKMPKAYAIKAEIIKGHKTVIKGQGAEAIFLAPAQKGSTIIPWKLSDRDSTPEPIKTISIPQMITTQRTQNDLQSTLNENVAKRLQHNLKRAGLL